MSTLLSHKKIWPTDRPFPTLGYVAIQWIEANTVHGPGDIRGEKTHLSKDKKRFLLKVYEYHPEAYCMREGCPCEDMFCRRVYKEGIFSRIKGSAKTELIAHIALFELMGPARFAGWDDDGDPIGQLVNSPYIPIAATSEEQAEDTLWGTLLAIARESRKISGKINARERDILFYDNGGIAKIVNSSSIRNDGGKPTFTGIDEAHLFTSADLKNLGKALKRNTAKRKEADGWVGIATTMFKVGERSLAEDEWELAHGKNIDLAVLYDHLEAPPGFDTNTDEGLRDAVIAAAGDAAAWLPIIDVMRSYRDDPIEGERYWLNRYGGASDKLVQSEKWRLNPDADGLVANDIVAIGVDGSMYSDSTAVTICRLSDMSLHTLFVYYPDGTDEDAIRMGQAMNQTVRQAMKDYLVTRIYCDPPYIQETIALWTSVGLTLKQKIPTKVVSWWTNVETRMAKATLSFVQAVHKFEQPHDHDPELSMHVENAYRKEVRAKVDDEGVERQGFVPRKLHPKSHKKIDLCVTAILARQAALDSIEAGEDAKIGKRKRSGFVSM